MISLTNCDSGIQPYALLFIYLFNNSASPKKAVWQGHHNSFRQLLYYLAWDSNTRIGIISSATEAKELYATYRLKTNYFDISITVLKFLE